MDKVGDSKASRGAALWIDLYKVQRVERSSLERMLSPRAGQLSQKGKNAESVELSSFPRTLPNRPSSNLVVAKSNHARSIRSTPKMATE